MKFRDTLIGIVLLGAFGSIVGNKIQEFAKAETDYSGFKRFIVSEITIPSWSLLSLIMIIILLIYIMVLRNRDQKRILKEKDIDTESKINQIKKRFTSPDDAKKEREDAKKALEEKSKRYQLAKLLINYLHEGYPKTTEDLCKLIGSSETYPKSMVMETISELVHHNIFESYVLGDGFKLAYNHQKILDRAFKP